MTFRVPTSRYFDLAVDDLTGRVFAVDSMYRVVDQMNRWDVSRWCRWNLSVAGPIAVDGATVLIADGAVQMRERMA